MLVFNFFKIAAKVLHQSMPWEKSVQKRASVAKFPHLWRNSAFFVANFPTINKKRRKILRLIRGNFARFLHSYTLGSTARLTLTLAGALLQFHLAETEGQADRDATAVVFVVGGGIHVGTVVRLSPTVPVEDVVGIDIYRQLTVEEVGT